MSREEHFMSRAEHGEDAQRKEAEPKGRWTRESVSEAVELARRSLGPWLMRENEERGPDWIRRTLDGEEAVYMQLRGWSVEMKERRGDSIDPEAPGLHWVVRMKGHPEIIKIFSDQGREADREELTAKAKREVNAMFKKDNFLFVDD